MGGPEEIRTLDLRYAKATLYQLSYRPKKDNGLWQMAFGLLHIAYLPIQIIKEQPGDQKKAL